MKSVVGVVIFVTSVVWTQNR